MATSLVVSERNSSGKTSTRKLRHEGYVPGVVYGDGKSPVLVSVGEKELVAECYSSAFLGHVIEANIGGKLEKFLPKQVEFDPVSDRPVHVDFLRISKNSKVKVSIAIEFVNEDKSPGIKKGGVVNVVVHKLECFCSPNAIPEKFTLDLTGKDIGDGFALDKLDLPEGVTPVNTERDAVIATIVSAKMVEEEPVTAVGTPDAETKTETPADNAKKTA